MEDYDRDSILDDEYFHENYDNSSVPRGSGNTGCLPLVLIAIGATILTASAPLGLIVIIIGLVCLLKVL